jgi:hypothetical protein
MAFHFVTGQACIVGAGWIKVKIVSIGKTDGRASQISP